MGFKKLKLLIIFLMLGLLLLGCGPGSSFGGKTKDTQKPSQKEQEKAEEKKRETIWDLFRKRVDENATIAVNKYLWSASLEVLDFMPVELVDPFSGVIIFGYGKAPGSSQAYRAKVLISDPALDLRSLSLALATKSGPASTETARRVENAILTRARQLRQRDKGL